MYLHTRVRACVCVCTRVCTHACARATVRNLTNGWHSVTLKTRALVSLVHVCSIAWRGRACKKHTLRRRAASCNATEPHRKSLTQPSLLDHGGSASRDTLHSGSRLCPGTEERALQWGDCTRRGSMARLGQARGPCTWTPYLPLPGIFLCH